jgi:hypothetical protein
LNHLPCVFRKTIPDRDLSDGALLIPRGSYLAVGFRGMLRGDQRSWWHVGEIDSADLNI